MNFYGRSGFREIATVVHRSWYKFLHGSEQQSLPGLIVIRSNEVDTNKINYHCSVVLLIKRDFLNS